MKQKIDEAIHMLRCAEINCDNGQRVGQVMFGVVKTQVQEAMQILEIARGMEAQA